MIAPPKVSIIIPVYNGADFLAEAIDSALAQTYPNFEILVVNDGSNDDGATERIVHGYGKNVSYCSKPNGGVASALNLAVEKMNGDFFSWLSHDDLYLPQKVEREMNALRAQGNERSIIYSDYATFTDTPEKSVTMALKHVEPEQFRYWITIENALHGCTLLIPRAAFVECGGFNEALRTTQDYDLWFRMARHYRFVHIPEVLVKGRSHPGQGSIRLAGVALAECNALLTRFVSELSKEELTQGSNRASVVGYAEIAASMWQRGFTQAGSRSFRLTVQNLSGANVADRIAAISVLAKGSALGTVYDRTRRMARRMLPPNVRGLLRNWLTSAVAVSPTAVDAVQHLALKEKFTEVYDKNIFGGPLSRSGAGSDLVQTAIIRREIPRILRQYGIGSMLDAPCGDWHWMREVALGATQYTGADIVAPLIAGNTQTFGRPGVAFQCLDLTKHILPQRDLILSRDCLVHLSFHDAMKIIANFKASGAKYLLTTTFTQRVGNTDLGNDFWRPLNMTRAPFNFPAPLETVDEGCTEAGKLFADKSLGLWRLDDIHPSFLH